MTCLICQYFKSVEPEQHKQEREAGKCEFHCGKEWSTHTAINYLKHHNGGSIDGWCLLHPEPKQKKAGHVCGQISVLDYFKAHWGVRQLSPDENISKWAQDTLTTVVHGTWQAQRAEEFEEQNKKLRAQLKRVQQISASRLRRLQKPEKLESKLELQREEEPTTPAYPYSIAAE